MKASEEEERRARAERELKKLPGVLGVGIGLKMKNGEITNVRSLRVFVSKKRPLEAVPAEERIPAIVDGMPTDVAEVKRAKLYSEDVLEHNPLVTGVSLATPTFTLEPGRRRFSGAGTLGFFATVPGTDPEREMRLISNEHVLLGTHAAVGDPVYQPGMTVHPNSTIPLHIIWTIDARTRNLIGAVEDGERGQYDYAYPDAVSDRYGIDCASARLDIRFSGTCCRTNQGVSLRNAFRVPQTNGVQSITGVSRITTGHPDTGPLVYMVGRTTGATVGRVVAAYESTVDENDLPAMDKVMHIRGTGPEDSEGRRIFARHGDSGAALLDAQGRLVGLFYGGDETGEHGFACHIHPVLHRLGVEDRATHTRTPLEPITDEHPPVGPAARTLADVPATLDAPNHVRELRLKLLHTELGKSTLELLERHEEEVGRLIKYQRKMTLAWHRAQGPAFVNRLLANARDPSSPIPEAINGVTRAEFLRAFDAALREHASPTLRAALERYAEQIHALEPRLGNLHALADAIAEEEMLRKDERASA